MILSIAFILVISVLLNISNSLLLLLLFLLLYIIVVVFIVITDSAQVENVLICFERYALEKQM